MDKQKTGVKYVLGVADILKKGAKEWSHSCLVAVEENAIHLLKDGHWATHRCVRPLWPQPVSRAEVSEQTGAVDLGRLVEEWEDETSRDLGWERERETETPAGKVTVHWLVGRTFALRFRDEDANFWEGFDSVPRKESS